MFELNEKELENIHEFEMQIEKLQRENIIFELDLRVLQNEMKELEKQELNKTKATEKEDESGLCEGVGELDLCATKIECAMLSLNIDTLINSDQELKSLQRFIKNAKYEKVTAKIKAFEDSIQKTDLALELDRKRAIAETNTNKQVEIITETKALEDDILNKILENNRWKEECALEQIRLELEIENAKAEEEKWKKVYEDYTQKNKDMDEKIKGVKQKIAVIDAELAKKHKAKDQEVTAPHKLQPINIKFSSYSEQFKDPNNFPDMTAKRLSEPIKSKESRSKPFKSLGSYGSLLPQQLALGKKSLKKCRRISNLKLEIIKTFKQDGLSIPKKSIYEKRRHSRNDSDSELASQVKKTKTTEQNEIPEVPERSQSKQVSSPVLQAQEPRDHTSNFPKKTPEKKQPDMETESPLQNEVEIVKTNNVAENVSQNTQPMTVVNKEKEIETVISIEESPPTSDNSLVIEKTPRQTTRTKQKKATTPARVEEKNKKIPNSKQNSNKATVHDVIVSPDPPKLVEIPKISEPLPSNGSPKATTSAKGKNKLAEFKLDELFTDENSPPAQADDQMLPPKPQITTTVQTRSVQRSTPSPLTPLSKQNSKEVISEDEALSDTEMNQSTWETSSNGSLSRMFANLSDDGVASGGEGSADAMDFSFSPPSGTYTENGGQKKNDAFDFFGDAEDNSNQKSPNFGMFGDDQSEDVHFSLF